MTRLSLAALLALSCPALASGPELLVGSGLGDVARLDPGTGKITNLGNDNCGYPNGAILKSGSEVLVAQQCGLLLHLSGATGAVNSTVSTPTMIQDMAFDGPSLLAVTAHNTLIHIDPATGAVLDERQTPAPGLALAIADGTAYIITAFAVYSAPAASGPVTLLHDFGNRNGYQAGAASGGALLVGNVDGEVVMLDRASGAVLGSRMYPPALLAIVADGQNAYLGINSGEILRVDLASGSIVATLTAGIRPDNLSLAAADPCAADINGDHALNVADFGAFLQAFARRDAAADANHDGSLNVADFSAFMQAFARGCP